jgi:site-specific DNA-cytosine methylase
MPDGITPALTNPGNGGRADAINIAVGCMTPELPQRVRVHGTGGTSPTLSSEEGRGHGVPTILAFKPGQSEAAGGTFVTKEFAPTLQSQNNGSTAVPAVQQSMAVRRLTPRECERLQGFKDDHTLIPWRGKPAAECPDGPRYKALGNSMAVPCMAWIGRRIAAQEMLPLRYLSVCSGIEAASVAWEPLGWQPAAFAEVEKFPSAVLAHHWPHVPNLGDMTKYEEWKLGTIDLLAGGTPCQSFSVAGLRQGLRDPRGGLMLTYLEIAQRHRPRWLVWENVPGVLSSHGGRDFGAFLGALGALGYGWAYRVLDAQWFGVAQRRRRVFVVGCAGDGAAAATVLFESESVCRNPAPSREKGQGVAADAAGGAGGGRRGGYDAMSLAGTLGRRGVRSHTELDGHGAYIPQTVGTLSDGAHNGGGLNGQDAYSGRIFPTTELPAGQIVRD